MSSASQIATAGGLNLLADLSLDIRYLPVSSLRALGRKARTHSKQQLHQIAQSIRTFVFVIPVVVVDEDDRIIAGNARIEAALQLGMTTVPVVTLSHLTPEEKRALVLAENQLATLGGWDRTALKFEFQELLEFDLDFELDVTGFDAPQIPGASHCNRVQLGKHGRDHHNVWTYPGVNGFGSEKAREREMHPTVKPLTLVRDAILDSTARGDLVFDPFSGSGTTIMAAEVSGRHGAAIDLDPGYIDTAILRWQDFTGQEAILSSTGEPFRTVRAKRKPAPAAAADDLPPARARARRVAWGGGHVR